jgi:F-type H+-transporting ATPase subunit epsilon
MNLKILLPTEIFVDRTDVLRIVAETDKGSFGLLPHRLDCAAALLPGIFIYESAQAGISYVAVDAGVLVKTGMDVLVSVRRAISGTDLNQLHDEVKRQFLKMDKQEQEVRTAVTRMEAAMIGRFAELQHE